MVKGHQGIPEDQMDTVAPSSCQRAKTTRHPLCQLEIRKIELPNGEVQGQRQQVPLILSWALSIHKAQGQTLRRVRVDLRKVLNCIGMEVINLLCSPCGAKGIGQEQSTARDIAAAAALYAAAKHCNVGVENDERGKPWWRLTDVDIHEVRRTVMIMAQLYEQHALKRNMCYLSAPTASDEGTEKTRILRAGGSASKTRTRSREPEHDRILPSKGI
ncbi:uncharacterized protein BO95DRAFT_468291 [Aspergillus brunneoviolaceus CBS 621.78]|uniref:Uncharacterized protein n=1 Tax=Aspergillus brunneoviolaceus CBS 621.78 TaxID=1450534 RepID=A0ACD1FV87_9EURO|nr:hypothetical protein BO95DRAFT_468291 [Aspergillus brunneoviolaceus CBS 621.78]RAH40900.1 hypothetical protein BO95DRAFT_468291 [Aspergillus brunneoviolaceus CBS 621.78]